MVEKIIAKERPDAILPTMGGQTALNCALDLHAHGVLEKYKVELIGATPEAIDKAEDRLKFKDAMTKIGLGSAKSGIAHSMEEALQVQAGSRRNRQRRLSDRDPSAASRSAAPAAASPTTRKSSRRSASAASTSRRPASC